MPTQVVASQDSGLSIGAIVGIVVGTVVVLMLAVVLVMLAVVIILKHTTNKQIRYSHVQSMAAMIILLISLIPRSQD